MHGMVEWIFGFIVGIGIIVILLAAMAHASEKHEESDCREHDLARHMIMMNQMEHHARAHLSLTGTEIHATMTQHSLTSDQAICLLLLRRTTSHERAEEYLDTVRVLSAL